MAHPHDNDALEEKVRHSPDLQAIHNYLHLPHTPAPNKARVLTIGLPASVLYRAGTGEAPGSGSILWIGDNE